MRYEESRARTEKREQGLRERERAQCEEFQALYQQ